MILSSPSGYEAWLKCGNSVQSSGRPLNQQVETTSLKNTVFEIPWKCVSNMSEMKVNPKQVVIDVMFFKSKVQINVIYLIQRTQ